MTTFLATFLGVLCALIVINLIGWLVFWIWWNEPFKKRPAEPKPQATFKEDSSCSN
jgi:hypothetical protein